MKRNFVIVFSLFFFALFTFSVVPAEAQVDFTDHYITDYFDHAWTVLGVDLDSDADIDVVGGANSEDGIKWWENGGNQDFTEHSIDDGFSNYDLNAVDWDFDGDIDLVSASSNGISWWENDGDQDFEEHSIDEYIHAGSIFVIDIDGDEDLDIACADRGDSQISWLENYGNNYFTENVMRGYMGTAKDVFVIDLDNDDDMDILGCASTVGAKWWENDGYQNFESHDFSNDGPDCIFAVDMDDDGDVDILGAYRDVILWENDGDCGFSEVIISETFDGGDDILATDINLDGELDIVAVSGGNRDNVSWWEHDGELNFTEYSIDGCFNTGNDISVVDIDGDGDVDLLGAASHPHHEIMLWKNRELDTFASVGGMVTDFETHDPIEGATVSFDDFETVTDEWGIYTLDLWVETFTVVIEADRYNPLEETEIELDEGENTYNFELFPSPHINVEVDSLQELFCFEGETVFSGFTISNDGWGNLHWQVAIEYDDQDSLWLFFDEEEGSIEPDDFINVEMMANAEDLDQGYYFAMFSIISNDPSNDPIEIHVYLTVEQLGMSDVTYSMNNGLPRVFDIEEIYPNPFNPSTSVVVGLPEPAFLNLTLHNISGQKVAVLANGQYTSGYKQFTINGSMMASGIYFVHMQVPEKTSAIRKVVLVK
ncbi:MAG: FG-GAP-like repeat-containing protein [Candidatus Electryonea clarkiae]|nr:FG-GAP-like repeat-containing protein [Candidatus Electryonea clarkiae]MDP8288333.1 FG-GAP-like repeat-containing protein [Candidatus Electryonea clarkiae]